MYITRRISVTSPPGFDISPGMMVDMSDLASCKEKKAKIVRCIASIVHNLFAAYRNKQGTKTQVEKNSALLP